MALYDADGNRLTRAAFPSTEEPAPPTQVRVTENVYETTRYDRESDPFGTRRALRFRAGQVVPESEVDAAFPTATVTGLSPATGPAAGGTVVTATGTDLDGVTGVTVGGAAATGVEVLSPTQVRFTTPAGTAGARDVVVTDDAGSVTATGAFTYA